MRDASQPGLCGPRTFQMIQTVQNTHHHACHECKMVSSPGVGCLVGDTWLQNLSFIKRVISSPDFDPCDGGKLGGHSVRKLASMEAKKKGVPEDDLDCKFQWARKTGQQDSKTSAQLHS